MRAAASDGGGDGLRALLTAAQTRVGVARAPVPDLVCGETLPDAEVARVVDTACANAIAATKALFEARCRSQRQASATGAVPTDCVVDEKRIDNFYWEKHELLRTMLCGFVGMMVRKFEQINAQKPPEKRRILVISNVYHETRADVPRGKLKTIGDLQHLDQLIADMLATHTRVIAHVTQKRELPDAASQAPPAKRGKVEEF
jgi:hypothetical protein